MTIAIDSTGPNSHPNSYMNANTDDKIPEMAATV